MSVDLYVLSSPDCETIVGCNHLSRDIIVDSYFINKRAKEMAGEEEVVSDNHKCQYVMAHNGWVMNDDPMRDFARPGNGQSTREYLYLYVNYSCNITYEMIPSWWFYISVLLSVNKLAQ